MYGRPFTETQRHRDTESPLRLCKPSPWPDVHLPNFVTIRVRQSVNTSLFTLWVVVCQHYIAGSDTSQIPSDLFFSYNIGVFTLHSVFFSVTLKKSKQKKSQTNHFYVQIRPSTEFGPQSFFFFQRRTDMERSGKCKQLYSTLWLNTVHPVTSFQPIRMLDLIYPYYNSSIRTACA